MSGGLTRFYRGVYATPMLPAVDESIVVIDSGTEGWSLVSGDLANFLQFVIMSACSTFAGECGEYW